MVTAPTREVLETYVRPRLEHFLQERGLAFNEAKTRIVHIREGVNFLGFHLRQCGRREPKLLTVPHKANVLAHLRAIRAYLDAHKQTPAVQVIKALNPVIRGWAQYYRHVSAKARPRQSGPCPRGHALAVGQTPTPKEARGWVKAHYLRRGSPLDFQGR